MKDLVMRRRIKATPETVFGFLTDADKLVRWIGTQVIADAHPGGTLDITMDEATVMHGAFVELVPHRRVTFTWGWEGNNDVPPSSTTVAFELVADGECTELTLTHSGLPLGEDDAHGGGWTYFLLRLRTVGEGGANGPIDFGEMSQVTTVLVEAP